MNIDCNYRGTALTRCFACACVATLIAWLLVCTLSLIGMLVYTLYWLIWFKPNELIRGKTIEEFPK